MSEHKHQWQFGTCVECGMTAEEYQEDLEADLAAARATAALAEVSLVTAQRLAFERGAAFISESAAKMVEGECNGDDRCGSRLARAIRALSLEEP